MSSLEPLIEELERSYTEAQERMSDPAVYNDRREAEEVGRRLKKLEGPYRLSQAWRQAHADLEAARSDPELAEMVAGLRGRGRAGSRTSSRLALVETDPADEKDVIVEIRQGVGGDEAALWAGDLARMLERYAERRGFRWEQLEVSPTEGGGIKEGVYGVKGDGAYSVFKYEGGTHRVQRVPDTESQGRIHTSTGDDRRDARGRGRRRRDRRQGPQDRRLPLVRPRRPVGEHDRLRRADHPPPDRARGRDAGRALAAPEQGQGDARAPRPPLRGRAREAALRAGRRAQRAGRAAASGPRRSAPTTSRRTASPTTGSA